MTVAKKMIFELEDVKHSFYIISPDGEKAVNFKIKLKSVCNQYLNIIDDLEMIMNDRPDIYEKYFDGLYKYVNPDKIDEFQNIQDDTDRILNYVDELIIMIDDWFNNQWDFDYAQFCDSGKKKHDSIFLDESKIKIIIFTSINLKFFSPIFASNHSIAEECKEKIFHKIIDKAFSLNIFNDILDFIDMEISKNKKTSSGMFEMLKQSIGKSPDELRFEILIFILYNTLTCVSITKNPAIYLSVTIRDFVSYFLKTAFSKTTVYIDENMKNDSDMLSILNMNEDKKSNTINFAFNIMHKNVITRIVEFLNIQLDNFNIDRKLFISHLSQLYITPYQQFVVFPIMCKVFKFDYNYLNFITSVEAYYLQLFFEYILKFMKINDEDLIFEINKIGLNRMFIEKQNSLKYKNVDILKTNIDFVNNTNKLIYYKNLDTLYKMYSEYELYDIFIFDNDFFKQTNDLLKDKINKYIQSINNILAIYHNEMIDYDHIKNKVFSMMNHAKNKKVYKTFEDAMEKVDD